MMQYNSNQIAQILPHRYPSPWWTASWTAKKGKWAKGIKCVSVNEPFFQGHFPQYHVMPGVLILEALAQVGAVALLSMPENRARSPSSVASRTPGSAARSPPATYWSWECTLIKQKGPVGIGSAKATVNGQVAATAELTFALGKDS